MDVIDQRLVVKEWPLKKPGDELFFGYVLAVGLFPREWTNDGMFAYADFAYNDSYTRYRLPPNESLKAQLLNQLIGNVAAQEMGVVICGKVWVKRTDQGYEVNLP